MAQENINLYKGSLKYEFEDSKTDVTADGPYDSVSVVGGKWILYENKDYNPNSGSGKYLILDKPTTKTKLAFSPGSLWRAEDNEDGCTLFEHFNFGGVRKTYRHACEDITGAFPVKTVAGASSMIIWPNKAWQLFDKKNYQGGYAELEPKSYTSFDVALNDKVQSIRPA